MAFVKAHKQQSLEHINYVTCMTKINKSLNEEKAIQMLVVGTEHCDVIVLEPSGLSVKTSFKLPSQPV
jgi:hypothetical protein